MILTGNQIIEEVHKGGIIIEPFDESCVNPNSYNFTLSDTFLLYEEGVIDTKLENPTRVVKMVNGEIVLKPWTLYLAATRERIGSHYFAPTYAARSSVARLGMFINLSAPLGDIGFVGNWTLQLFAIHPIRVYEGMRIGQMMFWQPSGERMIYDGKYQNATGPMKSQIYKDVAKLASIEA
ncbi:dCTP deaminase [Paraburkholderia megapolitana]|uniref:dCTP deaminase n=1 Tax=Paraburkholderia megapolitana TaxID=420953 RepID=UPI0038BDC69E